MLQIFKDRLDKLQNSKVLKKKVVAAIFTNRKQDQKNCKQIKDHFQKLGGSGILEDPSWARKKVKIIGGD